MKRGAAQILLIFNFEQFYIQLNIVGVYAEMIELVRLVGMMEKRYIRTINYELLCVKKA